MAEQTRKPKPKGDAGAGQTDVKKKDQKKTDEVDELLDEIDEVLEVNAEDFVRSFVQKGGQ
jgi:ubiquitin-like protein Pup